MAANKRQKNKILKKQIEGHSNGLKLVIFVKHQEHLDIANMTAFCAFIILSYITGVRSFYTFQCRPL
jgi:hypothetical protein